MDATKEGSGKSKLKNQFVRVRKTEYDELCHKIRHLQTLAARYDKRAKKMFELIFDMAEEIQVKRAEIYDKIQSLEASLSKVNGTVTQCETCLHRDKCDAVNTDSGNNTT